MKPSVAGAASGDPTVRDLLSSLAALQALSMVMTDNRGEDEILDLAVAALPTLTRQCRVQAVWLDEEWRAVDCLRGRVCPRTDLEAAIAELGGGGGALQWPGVGWAWAFPLSSRGGASGHLVVGSPERPAEYEWSLIQALAQETGMALANARLLARERAIRSRIVDEQATLRRLGTLAAEAAPPDEVFAAVAAEAGRLLEVDFALVSRYNPDGAATVLGSWAKAAGDGPLAPGTRIEPGGRSVHSLVFQTGRPARVEDYGDESVQGARIAHEWGVRSVVAVPVHLERRLWGVIGVASRREEPLPPDTEQWLAGFTELVATAVANAQARTELSGFAEEQAALRRVATLVARAASPGEVFVAVTEEVGRLLEADFAVLSRYAADDGVTVLGAWARADPGRPLPIGVRLEPGGHNVHALVAQTRRPARIHYADSSGAAADIARQWGFRSAVGVPIMVEDRLWGVVSVGSASEEPLPAGTEERLTAFSELVATAIANAQARVELHGFAEEQAALRRVATLVARSAPSEEVFGAVTAEIGQLLEADFIVLGRLDPDGAATVLGAWTPADPTRPVPIGLRLSSGGHNVHTVVFRTGRPARIEDHRDPTGSDSEASRPWAFRSAVGAPISVEGRLWGVITVGSRDEPLPAGTEERLAGFSDLVGTALANAEAQAALRTSRARIVAASDTARRRIERDLHDGAQQHLVSLALQLRAAQASVPPGHELETKLHDVADGLDSALQELHDLARGIHPTSLARGGLPPAVKTLARRSAVPVRLDVRLDGRLPEAIELAAYHVVAEALTNAAKHAGAAGIDIEMAVDAGVLQFCVRDDGRGGADLDAGSGLVGLTDRVEALGGRLSLHSPPGGGTQLAVTLPLV
jgi:GAF domain-containing protein